MAFLAVGVTLYLYGDTKTEKMTEDLDELFWRLKEKRLDPLIEEIIGKRQTKEDPHKVMSLTEVTERLRAHKRLTDLYNDADEYRFVIGSTISYAYLVAFLIGAFEIGYGIGEAYFFGQSDYATANLVALGLGTLFLGIFMLKYRGYANGYIEAVREVRRSCA
ncbi:MAG: hypothetical protein LYZ70_04530 [Nitrososphaerales archaeon]|nr:hypothetical protein [Nitrososphaerales archaeon]